MRIVKTLLLCMVFVMFLFLPGKAFATPQDVGGHWAGEQIREWLKKGLVSGYPDGTFQPDSTITRAEFITLTNKAFGFNGTLKAEFTDVSPVDWFAGEVEKAMAVGYISGYEDRTLRPNNRISRQEAAVILAKIVKLNSDNHESINIFVDAVKIPQWSRGAVASVVAKGYMKGYPDKTYQPEKLVTRAEAVSTLYRALHDWGEAVGQNVNYDQAGTYGPSSGSEIISGNATITVRDVKLQNLVIMGDLLLSEGIGDGDVTLKNVTVKGNTVIKGGGSHSVVLEDCTLPNIMVSKEGVRVVASGNTKVNVITLESGATLVEATTAGEGFEQVTVSEIIPADKKVILEGTFAKVEVAAKVEVDIANGTIQSLTLAESAKDAVVNIATEATVEKATLNAAVKITGEGKVTEASINASGASISQKPDTVNVAPSVNADVGGSTVNNNTSQSKIISNNNSGSNDGGNNRQSVSIQSINNITLFIEESEEISVISNPADATITAVSSDDEVAAVSVSDQIISVESGTVAGTATITVTGSKTGYSSGSRTFTVTVNPGVPDSFTVDARSGSLYIDLNNIVDTNDNPITWLQLSSLYGVDMENSAVYLTDDDGEDLDVFATLDQLTSRTNTTESGSSIYLTDEDLAGIMAGTGADGMFVGFDSDVHTLVYVEIQGTDGLATWEINADDSMPDFSSDSSDSGLSVLTIGGEDAIGMTGLEVDDPVNDEGATLEVADFTGFAGIVATASDPNALSVTVTINGMEIAAEDLEIQVITENDVIVVTVLAEDGTPSYYKVTVVAVIAGPQITSVVAADDGGNNGLGNNDTITITFDVSTNQPSVATKADIDALIDVDTKVLGSDYTGVWTDAQTLVITIIDAEDGTIDVGDTLTIKEDGLLKTADDLSLASTDTGIIEGTFGDTVAPSYVSAVMDNGNQRISLTFSENIVNNTEDNEALKTAVTLATDGTNFNALEDEDSVSIDSSTLVIDFGNALVGNENKIRLAANTLKDTSNNVLSQQVDTAALGLLHRVLTNNTANDENVDAASDGLGNIHVVYERSGNVYYKEHNGTAWISEVNIGSGSAAAIGVDSNGNPSVAFLTEGNVVVTTRSGDDWSEATVISSGSYVDIDVDENDNIHLVYESSNFDNDGYQEILYTNNASGEFAAPELVFDGWYENFGGGRTGRYYYSPTIKVDGNGNYHIAVRHHAMDGAMGWTDHNYYIVYKSNAFADEIGSESNGNADMNLTRGGLAIDSNGNPQIVYSNGTVYKASPVPGSWNRVTIGAGTQATIDIGENDSTGIAYSNGTLHFARDDGADYSIRSSIDTLLGIPAAVQTDTNNVIYSKSDGADNEINIMTW